MAGNPRIYSGQLSIVRDSNRPLEHFATMACHIVLKNGVHGDEVPGCSFVTYAISSSALVS